MLPDLEAIRAVERPDDRHCYLMLRFAGGLEVPSWRTSDGTLRLLALTLLAYLPEPPGISLIEEPENGVHPQAVAAIVQSLSSRRSTIASSPSPSSRTSGRWRG